MVARGYCIYTAQLTALGMNAEESPDPYTAAHRLHYVHIFPVLLPRNYVMERPLRVIVSVPL